MRLGLDLDGVVFDFLGATRQVFPSIPKQPSDFNLENYLSEHDKKRFHAFVTDPKVFRHLEILPRMESLFGYFNSHDTYIISSRWKNVHDATKQRLKEVGLYPVETIFTSRKPKAVKNYKIDVMIEDQPKHVVPMDEVIYLMPELSYNREFIHDMVFKDQMVFPYTSPEELKDFLVKLEVVK